MMLLLQSRCRLGLSFSLTGGKIVCVGEGKQNKERRAMHCNAVCSSCTFIGQPSVRKLDEDDRRDVVDNGDVPESVEDVVETRR